MAFEKNNQSKDLFSSQVDIQTKRFFFDLKENHKGRYLRITEQSGGRSSIVVPVEGLDEFENQIKIAISKLQDWTDVLFLNDSFMRAFFWAITHIFPI